MPLKRPLLKHEILEAQKTARSANECARNLGVSLPTYKKYAKLYGLYENVLNKSGVGIDKGFSYTKKHSTKIEDVLDNKHPRYPLQRLRYRLVRRGMIRDQCDVCGFEEKRITDKKKPLVLTFKGKHGDYSLDNLQLLCYNCVFLTKGAPAIVNRRDLNKALQTPEELSERIYGDKFINPDSEDSIGPEPDETFGLSEEDIEELKREIAEELSR